ncbi:MAG TPA: hypothetical protein VN628_04310, partial [Vicinamibacterales bacterium]|nr:hypothetical protein [Vicinamibacterales bacterium]
MLGAAAIVLLSAPGSARAEWQLKPFVAGTYGGETTFLFTRQTTLPAANYGHAAFGVSGLWLGEIFGLEADWGHTSKFFNGSEAFLVTDSGVTTLTGNVVVAMPRRLAEYGLRPYVVGGA